MSMKLYAHYSMDDREPVIFKSQKPFNEVEKKQEFLIGPKDSEFDIWLELVKFYHTHYLHNRDAESKSHVKKLVLKLEKADLDPNTRLEFDDTYKTA